MASFIVYVTEVISTSQLPGHVLKSGATLCVWCDLSPTFLKSLPVQDLVFLRETELSSGWLLVT